MVGVSSCLVSIELFDILVALVVLVSIEGRLPPASGSFHMSPVNQTGSVSEIFLTTLSFVKISMCSYEKPGWPGYRDLGSR